MPKERESTTIAGFIAVPVVLRSKAFGRDVKHYIYVKAYEPKIPDEESPRSLFLLNVPVTATETQIKHLFTTQIGGKHVQNVYFPDNTAIAGSASSLIATTKPHITEPATKLGKRKRSDQESSEEKAQKLSTYTLPATVPTQLHVTGSTAIAIFLDRTSRDSTLKACRRHVASGSTLIWSAGLDVSKLPPLGLQRFTAKKSLQYPRRAELLKIVEDYMTTYSEFEEAKSRENAKKRAEPDENGFITVTRGSKGVVKPDELEAIKLKLEKQKQKDKGLEDFYRFQMRERRKQEQGNLLRQFEQDRRKVRELEERRGKLRPE